MQTSCVRHDHRERHRYRSRLCARQHGRDRSRSDASLVGCASASANRAEKSKLTGGGRALVANPADMPPVQ